MKPYGRKKAPRWPSKEDCHPQKGWRNWWENMCDCLSRNVIKQEWRKQIEKEIEEYETESD